MDRRPQIVNSIRSSALRSGYDIICPDDSLSYTFDLIIKNESEMIIVKVMNNVGLLTEEGSSSLIALAKFLEAYPLVVGINNRDERIEDGVVYTRHSVPIISPQTFLSYVRTGEEPVVQAGPGGFYVVINSMKLKKIRVDRSLSLGEIANFIGTTRRTVLMYESGMSASIDIALKLEEFLGEEILEYASFLWRKEDEEINLGFKKMKEFERLVNNEISKKGFSIYPIKRSIVNFLMEDAQSSYFGGIEEELLKFSKKMKYLKEFSELSKKDGLLIVKKIVDKPKDVDIPVILYSELANFHDKDELKGIIKERRNS